MKISFYAALALMPLVGCTAHGHDRAIFGGRQTVVNCDGPAPVVSGPVEPVTISDAEIVRPQPRVGLVSAAARRVNIGDGKLLGVELPGPNVVGLVQELTGMRAEMESLRGELRDDAPPWVLYLLVALGIGSNLLGGGAATAAGLARSALLARYRKEDNLLESKEAARQALREKDG